MKNIYAKNSQNIVKIILPFFCSLIVFSCNSENQSVTTKHLSIVETIIPSTIKSAATSEKKTIKYLALGDSYTIGQSVSETCRFPEQLKKYLSTSTTQNAIALDIIAQTGWTTTDLLFAIGNKKPDTDYDLVTLLIGVNNQFQNRNFSLYEKEFPELVSKSIILAKGNKNNVIVLSIPDYAYTPYGQDNGNSKLISTEIDRYNAFTKSYCDKNSIAFINITDITRQGLSNPNLVANDGLHPSDLAYTSFLEFLIPTVKTILKI